MHPTQPPPPDPPIAIALSSITKTFGAVHALNAASITVRRNTIHALLGENGAGKTTLMRIAFGMFTPDAGTITINNTVRDFRSSSDAIAAGIGMVHQHFTLVPAMTVAENIALGRRNKPLRYNVAHARNQVTTLSRQTTLPANPDSIVGTLNIAAQQRVEILKALATDANILILDEPTAVLAPDQARELLNTLRTFADTVGTVILITHKLRDALEFADDITVLRHGQTVFADRTTNVTALQLSNAMIGATALVDTTVADTDTAIVRVKDEATLAKTGVTKLEVPVTPPQTPATDVKPPLPPMASHITGQETAVTDVNARITHPGFFPTVTSSHVTETGNSPTLAQPSATNAKEVMTDVTTPITASENPVTPVPSLITSPDTLLTPSSTPPTASEQLVPHLRAKHPHPIFRLRNVNVVDARGITTIHNASLTVHHAEIVGIAAVEGSGQHELLRVLAGRIPASTGFVEIPDTVGFIPEDRHRDALVLDFPLYENVALFNAHAHTGRLSWTRLREKTTALMTTYDVRAPHANIHAKTLSGGNQQKLIIAREINGTPHALIAENPTRGLDIQATQAVHQRLKSAKHQGTAIVVYSSDLDEILTLADRVIVIHAGTLHEVPHDRNIIGHTMLSGSSNETHSGAPHP